MTQPHTVLVIDDEPDVVKSVQDLLRLEYRVLGATRAADGLTILQKEAVHVVLTDQRMPGMSGVEFLHNTQAEYPDVIRIIFTGYADIHAVVEAINQGNVFRYVMKPWDSDELLGIIRDACQRYDLIVERRTLADELEAKNADLQRANTELQKADQMKHAFVQVAGHELRTPLTVLLMLAQLARKKPDLPLDTVDHLKRMEQAGWRLERLVKQITSVLNAWDPQRKLDLCRVDLAALLHEAAEELRPFIDLRKQKLVLEAPRVPGSACMDPSKISDVLQQLLLNAVKFTPDGGRIALAADRTVDGGVELRVSDSGVGIDASQLPHLFDPRFSDMDVLHHSSGVFEFQRKGLGLGLHVAKAFVELHGGKIAVQSKVGGGTTFTVSLPNLNDGVRPWMPTPTAAGIPAS